MERRKLQDIQKTGSSDTQKQLPDPHRARNAFLKMQGIDPHSFEPHPSSGPSELTHRMQDPGRLSGSSEQKKTNPSAEHAGHASTHDIDTVVSTSPLSGSPTSTRPNPFRHDSTYNAAPLGSDTVPSSPTSTRPNPFRHDSTYNAAPLGSDTVPSSPTASIKSNPFRHDSTYNAAPSSPTSIRSNPLQYDSTPSRDSRGDTGVPMPPSNQRNYASGENTSISGPNRQLGENIQKGIYTEENAEENVVSDREKVNDLKEEKIPIRKKDLKQEKKIEFNKIRKEAIEDFKASMISIGIKELPKGKKETKIWNRAYLLAMKGAYIKGYGEDSQEWKAYINSKEEKEIQRTRDKLLSEKELTREDLKSSDEEKARLARECFQRGYIIGEKGFRELTEEYNK